MISLGSIDIKSGLVLAPLAGYTDLPFRSICSEHGAALVYTELLSSEAITRKHQKTFDMMRISESERPVIIQLFGTDPDTMGKAAKIASESSPDGIDINMGCCVRKVCSTGAGAALLKSPDLLKKITDSVIMNANIPVSAKIRIGYTENNKNYREVVRILEERGVNHIAVHGRTASQQYTGKSDWNIISEIAAFSSIPVIGSGDIKSFADASEKLRHSGCRAVMIGRAAIGNPWIFSGETPSNKERAVTARNHLMSMIQYYGDYGLILSRKHLLKYFSGIHDAANFRGKIANTTSVDFLLNLLNDISNA